MSAPKRRTIDQKWSAQAMYPNRAGSTETQIEQEVRRLFPSQPYGTHGSVCADLLLFELVKDPMAVRTPSAYRDTVIKRVLDKYAGLVNTVLVYSKNDKTTGQRVPKDPAAQRLAFRRNLFAVYPVAAAALDKPAADVAEPSLDLRRAVNEGGKIRYGQLPIGAKFQLGRGGEVWTKRANGDENGGGGVGFREPSDSMVYPVDGVEPAKPECSECGKAIQSPGAVWWQNARLCARCYKVQQSSKPKRTNENPVNENPVLAHRDWSQEVRRVCESKAADGQPLWDWGMRNTLDGAAIILSAMQESQETAQQVSRAVRDACTMHFPDDVRREVGVTEPFDFVGFGVPRYLKLVSAARVPLPRGKSRSVCAMLVGPMGSGKSTAAESLADELGVPYGKVSMTRGTSPTAFNGKQRVTDDGSLLGVLSAIAKGEHETAAEIAQQAMSAGDVTVSQWVRIYTGGGVFLFDEIDAADSNLLLIVNDALSSAGFANAATGETLPRHEQFVGIAAGNTLGLGADRIYGGRERLDGASLDRWAAGRVRVGYDTQLEDSIIEGMVAA